VVTLGLAGATLSAADGAAPSAASEATTSVRSGENGFSATKLRQAVIAPVLSPVFNNMRATPSWALAFAGPAYIGGLRIGVVRLFEVAEVLIRDAQLDQRKVLELVVIAAGDIGLERVARLGRFVSARYALAR